MTPTHDPMEALARYLRQNQAYVEQLLGRPTNDLRRQEPQTPSEPKRAAEPIVYDRERLRVPTDHNHEASQHQPVPAQQRTSTETVVPMSASLQRPTPGATGVTVVQRSAYEAKEPSPPAAQPTQHAVAQSDVPVTEPDSPDRVAEPVAQTTPVAPPAPPAGPQSSLSDANDDFFPISDHLDAEPAPVMTNTDALIAIEAPDMIASPTIHNSSRFDGLSFSDDLARSSYDRYETQAAPARGIQADYLHNLEAPDNRSFVSHDYGFETFDERLKSFADRRFDP